MADKKKKKTKKKRRVAHPMRLFLSIYILALAALIVALYFVPWISDEIAEIMTVEYGQLNQSKDVRCYFVKNETVYYANANGRVGYLYAEGETVRAGQTLLGIDDSVLVTDTKDYSPFTIRVSEIYGGDNLIGVEDEEERASVLDTLNGQMISADNDLDLNKINLAISEVQSLSKGSAGGSGISIGVNDTGVSGEYVSNCSGIVSYQLDGYESEFNPYTMSLLNRDKLANLTVDSINIYDGKATAGQPVCKVVDDREWYAITWIDSSELSSYEEGGRVTLTLDGVSMKGEVYKVFEKDSGFMVIMHFISYYQNIASLRAADVSITTSDETGLVIKNTFIAEEDGVSGVYVLSVSGDTKFTPVKILASDGEYSLVSSGTFTNEDGELVNTVKVYDQIKKVRTRFRKSQKTDTEKNEKTDNKDSQDQSDSDSAKEETAEQTDSETDESSEAKDAGDKEKPEEQADKSDEDEDSGDSEKKSEAKDSGSDEDSSGSKSEKSGRGDEDEL